MERDPMEMALSTDIVLDKILSHLKVKDLLACRKVCEFWNKAASAELRKRPTMMRNISEENQLMELQECIQQSWNFPFTGLTFDQPWRLSSSDAMEFFKNHGARFKSLRLRTHLTNMLQDLAPFLHHLPRMSILELGCRHSEPPDVELLDPVVSKIVDLSSVRTIRIWSPYAHHVNENVLRQVFQAASSSELRIECLDASCEILRVLKDVGKLQAINVLHVENRFYANAWRMGEFLATETLELTEIIFQGGRCISQNGLIRLLVQSQHTLKKLCLMKSHPSEVLLEFPVLPKLSELYLWDFEACKYFFQGRNGHRFPTLQELKLGVGVGLWPSTAYLSDGLFVVPSLKKIELLNYVDKAGIEDLARSFPNVVQICLEASWWSTYKDLSGIWSVRAFKFLEKLVIWDYIVKDEKNMDSFLTGIPTKVCENLRKLPKQNLMDSPFNKILRNRPNLLQLKNGLAEISDDAPFISMASVWYALEMMPELTAKFVYEHSSSSQRFQGEHRDIAVTKLKDAFKHVQPYVELEPFFY